MWLPKLVLCRFLLLTKCFVTGPENTTPFSVLIVSTDNLSTRKHVRHLVSLMPHNYSTITVTNQLSGLRQDTQCINTLHEVCTRYFTQLLVVIIAAVTKLIISKRIKKVDEMLVRSYAKMCTHIIFSVAASSRH